MKKMIRLMTAIALITALCACGNSSASNQAMGQTAGVKDALEAGMAAEDNKDGEDAAATQDTGNENKPDTAPEEQAPGDESVDVDLTVLSATMVYSEVFNMVMTPDDYIGKTVKMKGLFNYYHDENTDLSYYSCIIQDATACCSQGLEFVLAGDYTYPDDYPELGSEICVIGEFDTYLENESTYCTLRNARLV